MVVVLSFADFCVGWSERERTEGKGRVRDKSHMRVRGWGGVVLLYGWRGVIVCCPCVVQYSVAFFFVWETARGNKQSVSGC